MSKHGYAHALVKGLGEFKGAAMNTSIAVLTIIIEEILNRTVYYCPCVEPSELAGCTSSSDSFNSSYICTQRINYWYGLSYIIGPSVALFVVMAASSPRLWKTWTGCCTKTRATIRRNDKVMWTLTAIFGRALIAPITWVCFALLDGRYYACAVTPLPYAIGDPMKSKKFVYAACSQVASKHPSDVAFSDAFSDNRSYSQLFGWAVTSGIVTIGFCLYAVSRCVYPLTYYHAKYFKIYQSFEESEFDDEMKSKAQKDAESNIRKFMAKDREKALWDQISTVFSFHRNPKNIALYSYLHEFILEEERNKPLLEVTDGGVNNAAFDKEKNKPLLEVTNGKVDNAVANTDV